MTKLMRYLISLVLITPAFAQTSLIQTTLGSTINSTQQTVLLTSVAGVIAPSPQTVGSFLFADSEIMVVKSISGNFVNVVRGQVGTRGLSHVVGAAVLVAPPNALLTYGPRFNEGCTPGVGGFAYAPVVASVTGLQWLCSSVTGTVVPGFSNQTTNTGVTAPVASVAGLVTPTGPLFHITGTSAITGFTIPVGFNPKGSGGFCVIPDGTFTTTNAGNIAIGSTAVVGKTLCFTYDASQAKFYPSY